MGDFIPQTPSLGTSPQTPSSLRGCLRHLAQYAAMAALINAAVPSPA